MAKVDEHLHQAKRNFKFLEEVNGKVNDSIDWQVTVCFYTALHLVNAHLAHSNLQYRTHTHVQGFLIKNIALYNYIKNGKSLENRSDI